MSKSRPRLFVINDPYAMRISRELAVEIGYNESVVLLQLEYLIGISTTEEHDGLIWTYQTLEELRDNYFPWWSTATISRILKSLEEKGLIKIGNYNKAGYDRTQWFALNPDGINSLKSIQLDDAIFQNEKWKRANCKMEVDKMKNAFAQNETTIPKTPTENPTETPDIEAESEPVEGEPAAAADIQAANLEALKAAGIAENETTRVLAGRPHITPEYIRAHAARFEHDHPGRPKGLLVRKLLDGDPAPELLERRERFTDQPIDDPPEPEGPGISTEASAWPAVNGSGLDARQAWERARRCLLQEIPRAAWEDYVEPAFLVAYDPDGGVFTIAAQDPPARDWLQSRLQATLTQSLAGIAGRPVEVAFTAVHH